MAAANFAFGANAHMQDARKSPEWFTRGVMYQIQPRAFTPEGTLKAAAEKLNQLQTDFIDSLSDEVDTNFDLLQDGDFVLNEFVDKYGPRFIHLNTILQV